MNETIDLQRAACPAPVPDMEPLESTTTASRIARVGAWGGAALLREPERLAKAALGLRLDELHLMLADHSAARAPQAYTARPPRGRAVATIEQLQRVGRACSAFGIELALTTWVMPHERYVEGCAAYLLEAVERLRAVGVPVAEVILDAEEPWTQATHAEWADAAAQLGDLLQPLAITGVRFGLTGIGYASERALDHLAAWCDFGVPQVYATTSNGMDARAAPRRFVERWRRTFELDEIVVGLPAYRQGPGMMADALEGVREAGVDRVIYWSLAHLQASRSAARVVSGAKG